MAWRLQKRIAKIKVRIRSTNGTYAKLNKRRKRIRIRKSQMILTTWMIWWGEHPRKAKLMLILMMMKMISSEEDYPVKNKKTIKKRIRILITTILWLFCSEPKQKSNQLLRRKFDSSNRPKKFGKRRNNWIIIWILNLWTKKTSGKRIWGRIFTKKGQIVYLWTRKWDNW